MVNKVILIGNLGADPVIRTLETGVKVAKFSIATTEKWKDKNGEMQSQTDWHNIVVWRGLAEVAEKYLKKGKLVYVEGKLANRSWEDENGIKRYATEVVANNFQMLGSKNTENGSSFPSAAKTNIPTPNAKIADNSTPNGETEDDLPF